MHPPLAARAAEAVGGRLEATGGGGERLSETTPRGSDYVPGRSADLLAHGIRHGTAEPRISFAGTAAVL
jgi:hypothetical protein